VGFGWETSRDHGKEGRGIERNEFGQQIVVKWWHAYTEFTRDGDIADQ